MKTVTKEGIIYETNKENGEFFFTIREEGVKREIVAKNITDESARSFYECLVENDVRPEHLSDVAEDFDFVNISILL